MFIQGFVFLTLLSYYNPADKDVGGTVITGNGSMYLPEAEGGRLVV